MAATQTAPHYHGSLRCAQERCKYGLLPSDTVGQAVDKVLYLAKVPLTAAEIAAEVASVRPASAADVDLALREVKGVRVAARGPDAEPRWKHKWASDHVNLKLKGTEKLTLRRLMALLNECGARIRVPRRRAFRFVHISSRIATPLPITSADKGKLEHARIGVGKGYGREEYGCWPPAAEATDVSSDSAYTFSTDSDVVSADDARYEVYHEYRDPEDGVTRAPESLASVGTLAEAWQFVLDDCAEVHGYEPALYPPVDAYLRLPRREGPAGRDTCAIYDRPETIPAGGRAWIADACGDAFYVCPVGPAAEDAGGGLSE